MNSLTTGRVFFALATIGTGLLQMLRQDFVRLVPKLPGWIPSHEWCATVAGGILVCAGVALMTQKWVRMGAMVIGVFLFSVLLLYVPDVLANPSKGYVWTNPFKTLALLAGVFLLGMDAAKGAGAGSDATPTHGWLLGAVLLGAFLVIGGVQHFVYANFVEQLVPVWMPGRRIWVFITGAALIAGGVGMVIPVTAHLVARLAALMIFLWVWMLHVPRALATWPETGETAAIFEALALAGTALIVAGAERKRLAAELVA